jgi:mannitol/fructose-specific phosphotransferase system IIA component (Ntr-type)
MPYQTLDLPAAADYLHLTRNELEQLVKTTDIPHQDRGGRIVFLRGELDAWASQRIMGLPPKRLAAYHQKSTQSTRAILAHEALLPNLLQPNFIATDFLASVEAREQLCSTGLPGGLAILHCRNLQPYRFEDSFIVVGRTVQEIHFGAPDGRPTWLFFLICCQDERIHLHTLARLCLIAQKTDVVARLLAAPDSATMYTELLAAEQSALAGKKTPANPAAVD